MSVQKTLRKKAYTRILAMLAVAALLMTTPAWVAAEAAVCETPMDMFANEGPGEEIERTYPTAADCDLNGDGILNSRDAIYLMYNTLLPNEYPVNKIFFFDLDRDGHFGGQDAVYLLYHVMLPDIYPI